MFDVISIGSATVDIFVQSKNFVLKKDKSFPSGQSLSLDFSSKSEISQFLISSGGGATNSAVAFSRLGLSSVPLSLIGSDLLSIYIKADLEKEHIPTSFLATSSREKTDFSVILVASNGGRSILTNRGSTHLLSRHLPWKKIKKTNWFYLTSLEGDLDLLEKIIGFAKENHIKIALNPGSREISQRQKLLPLLSHLDFLLLNQQEAEDLISFDYDQSSFFPTLQKLAIPLVALSRGRHGAHLLSPNQNLFSPALKSQVVDETGAGDAFGSTLVAALIRQLSPQEALLWALKNSSAVVSRFGAKTGLLTLSQITKIK
ncbi:carbohydrate kinase family protein [Patescibacteria group bacterium]|nr:carbohydrate kinase family protein [Patescibacteria group bacterium]